MYLNETYKKYETSRNKFYFGIFIVLFMIGFDGRAYSNPSDTIEVVAKYTEVEKGTIYEIRFELDKPISPNATIKATFPPEYDLSDVVIGGSTTINGGFKVEVKGQVVSLKRSGLGREIKSGEKVDVKFAIVKNPSKPADNYRIKIEILDDEEKKVVEQEKLNKIMPKKE